MEVRAECARLLAEAAGESGICGGQQLDMEGEGKVLTKEELMDINDRKTSAMIHAACGSDAREGKNTFMALYGLERCSAYVHELSEEAAAAVDGVFANSAFLRQLARSLADRKN